ncbi:hypothetical protein ANAPC1_01516 [Anaplasma phagocytophilum]|uniref:Uncharacterized protein n=1 Tax=Anaplasma phagocytophilum TaxID=948 RepID=A0AA45ZI99_ANAPH|nr:hypothetical protein ANAPC1_01516 [Anaplasma phagocytophilum]
MICPGTSPAGRGLRETSPDEYGTGAYVSAPAETGLNAPVTSTGRVCVRAAWCAPEGERGRA